MTRRKLTAEETKLQANLDAARKSKGHGSQHKTNPRKEILEALGDISGLQLFLRQVLIAQYVRSEKTSGGAYRTGEQLKEDEYQGKVGLVIGLGPLAFTDEPRAGISFGGVKADLHDWVSFSVRDGLPLDVNGYRCRLLDDALLIGKLKQPDMIY